MTEQNEKLTACAQRLFPLAALYIGSLSGGRAAVTETIAALRRKSPDAWESEVLPRLLRLCQTRAQERTDADDFRDDPALEPLLPILKLPPGSRCSLALSLCDIPPEEAAAARGINVEELAQKTEKAMRQLKFMRSGEAPQPEILQETLRHLPWHDSDTEALLAAAAVPDPDKPAEQDTAPIAGEIRKIARQDQTGGGKTVAIPLWGIAAGLLCLLLAVGGLLYFALRNPKPEQMQEPPEHAGYEPEEIKRFQEYLTLSEVQKKAAEYIGVPESEIVFLGNKLKPDEDPPRYEITFAAGGSPQVYTIDAKTGELLSKSAAKSEKVLNTSHWIPAAEMRQAALRCAGLTDALFLKEKLGFSSETGYYKYELLDGNGTLYELQFNAVTGMLLKYSAEEPAPEQPSNIIPPEYAKQQALIRAGNPDPAEVIFTKVKQEGSVYLIAFTMDNGTQYLMELNAEDGSVNTVDVTPVSADTRDAIGVIEAKKRAEAMAGLLKTQPVEYSKAKIERGNGAYVYELKFETDAYEYEVSVNTETGAITEYRAMAK